MALANGWVIACPKDCAGDSDALGDCTLYIEYFKRIKDVPGKKDNTPGRPTNSEISRGIPTGIESARLLSWIPGFQRAANTCSTV